MKTLNQFLEEHSITELSQELLKRYSRKSYKGHQKWIVKTMKGEINPSDKERKKWRKAGKYQVHASYRLGLKGLPYDSINKKKTYKYVDGKPTYSV